MRRSSPNALTGTLQPVHCLPGHSRTPVVRGPIPVTGYEPATKKATHPHPLWG